MNIQQVADEQKQLLASYGISLNNQLEDLSRPWGGYLVINPDDTATFIERYFAGADFSFDSSLDLQPKILMVLPGQRLSWQYHLRRAEYWRAVEHDVGYHKSKTDDMGQLKTLPSGDFVRFETEERHRLVGLDEVGVVAEIWQHTDPENPSDEDDIIRVQDDYKRA